MKKISKILLAFIPLILLSSCSKKVYPYEGEEVPFTLEKPIFITYGNYLGQIQLVGDDLDNVFNKYFKDKRFIETDSQVYTMEGVGFAYEDRKFSLPVYTTKYGLLFIHDIENNKKYVGLDPINYDDFNKDMNHYFDTLLIK